MMCCRLRTLTLFFNKDPPEQPTEQPTEPAALLPPRLTPLLLTPPLLPPTRENMGATEDTNI